MEYEDAFVEADGEKGTAEEISIPELNEAVDQGTPVLSFGTDLW